MHAYSLQSQARFNALVWFHDKKFSNLFIKDKFINRINCFIFIIILCFLTLGRYVPEGV